MLKSEQIKNNSILRDYKTEQVVKKKESIKMEKEFVRNVKRQEVYKRSKQY